MRHFMLFVCCVTAVGCRDAMTLMGDRVGDTHLLSSRPSERGGSTITEGERLGGWFDTISSDLDALEAMLRHLDFEIDVQVDSEDLLPGALRAWFDGFVMPTPANYVGPLSWIPSGPGSVLALDTHALVTEIDRACRDSLYQRLLGEACATPF